MSKKASMHEGLKNIQLKVPTLEELKKATKTTPSILEEAEELVGVEKRKEYGPAAPNFNRIKDMWNVILRDSLQAGMELTREEVAMMMVCLKIARWCEGHDKRDNLVDAAGYLRLIEMMRDELREEPLK